MSSPETILLGSKPYYSPLLRIYMEGRSFFLLHPFHTPSTWLLSDSLYFTFFDCTKPIHHKGCQPGSSVFLLLHSELVWAILGAVPPPNFPWVGSRLWRGDKRQGKQETSANLFGTWLHTVALSSNPAFVAVIKLTFYFFLKLRCNSHTIIFTPLKCTVLFIFSIPTKLWNRTI